MSLTGFTGINDNSGALKCQTINTSGTTGHFLLMSGNKFRNNTNGLILRSTDGVIISDGTTPGTHITIVPSDSIWTSNHPLQLLFGDNLDIDNIVIKAKPGNPAIGNGIYILRSTNSTVNNVSVSGRATGLRVQEEDNVTISNSLFEENVSGIITRGTNSSTILNVTANNNNFICNGQGVFADNNSVIDAANNYWGASDGSSSDTGSGDSYTESATANNEGFVNNTTTFLTGEDPNSPIGGRKIYNASTAQLTDGQTTTSTADSTDYGMVDIGTNEDQAVQNR